MLARVCLALRPAASRCLLGVILSASLLAGPTVVAATGAAAQVTPPAPAAERSVSDESGPSNTRNWPSTHGLAQAPLSAAELTPTAGSLQGVQVNAPQRVVMGQAFTVRLSGLQAAQASVRFLSEAGQDIRMANEALSAVPSEAWAGEYVVMGRIPLGIRQKVVYEVRLGEEVMRREIAVEQPSLGVQHLRFTPSVQSLLRDPKREAEEREVEQNYTLQTPKKWHKPFAPALAKPARITSRYGQPRTYGSDKVFYHFGVDYAGKVGTPILAINDGHVMIAGFFPVRGGFVMIDHGLGVSSLYFHLHRLSVKRGDIVTRGQKIGELGSSGLSTGPHLHLEMRLRGEAVDPAGWVNRLWPQ